MVQHTPVRCDSSGCKCVSRAQRQQSRYWIALQAWCASAAVPTVQDQRPIFRQCSRKITKETQKPTHSRPLMGPPPLT